MKPIRSLLTFALTMILFSSCNSISKNVANIQNLQKGMSKQQILELMGEPLKSEKYHEPNIWFYHTKSTWMDGIITRDECTPIVFDDLEMVSGWGYKFYKKEVLFK